MTIIFRIPDDHGTYGLNFGSLYYLKPGYPGLVFELFMNQGLVKTEYDYVCCPWFFHIFIVILKVNPVSFAQETSL